MQVTRSDLADLAYFVAIARHRNFRKAGLEVGVSASALSHSLKGLEERLGVRLLNRTNRSVTLTAAGSELLETIGEPLITIGDAVESMNRFRDAPAGRVRLNILEHAASLLLEPVLPVFVDRYPDIEIEIAVDNHMVDVVDHGFDAGIRYGGTVPEDMIARRLSADIPWKVAGSPAYFERFGIPEHPTDLSNHRCLKFRLGDDRMYRWEFERGDEELAIEVPGTITHDHTRLAIDLAIEGTGLAYVPNPCVAEEVEKGTLRTVLDEWAPTGPGFHIYYASRRQLPAGVKLLVELIQELQPLGM